MQRAATRLLATTSLALQVYGPTPVIQQAISQIEMYPLHVGKFWPGICLFLACSFIKKPLSRKIF